MAPTCPFCSEALPEGKPAKCPSCGEPLAERPAQPRGWGSDDQPISVLIIAGLQLSFSLLGLLGLLIGAVAMALMGSFLGAQAGAATTAMFGPPGSWLRTYMVLSQVLQGGGYIVAVAGGVGLFLMREWGRTLSLAVSGYAIAFTAINTVVTMPSALADAGPGPGQGAAVAIMGCTIMFLLALPVATLVVLTRPKVVAAYGRWERARAEGLKRPA